MDRSGLLSHASSPRRPTACAYVPVALTLGLFTLAFCTRLFFDSGDDSAFHGGENGKLGGGFLPKLFSLVSNDSLALHLQELTGSPHIAGTPENFETARYVKEKFESYGLQAHYADYPVLLSYPLRQSLRLVRPLAVNFSLREQPVHGDPFSASLKATDPFNAYSASGRVGGPGWAEGRRAEEGGAEVVYANYGRMEDFEELVGAIGKEKVKGTVALIRYGKTFRGDKVRNAEKFGVAAVILYSDPADYAPKGTDAPHVYPQAQWLPATGAQRGTVYTGKGDPATPGWPSHPGGERLSDEATAKRLPRIPVLPVSYDVAGGIMRHLGGEKVAEGWRGGMEGLDYVFGPGPAAVDVEVQMNATVTTIRNVIGVLPGSHQADRYVILGNHRDAWVFGAADPNSGTTCLLEVAHALGHMASHGWSPRRSIVFASWDAEEYGCLGSTEWAEDNAPVLATKAIAYINVDVAVGGGGFHASATPQLDDLIRDVSSQVPNPDGPAGESLLKGWAAEHNASEPELGRLGGGGSDYAAFLQHLGIAAADTHFGGSYPMYHSVYDNYHWMATFADPLFKRHVAVARMMAGVAARLAGNYWLPFNYTAYAMHLEHDVAKLQADLASLGAPPSLSFDPLHTSVSRLLSAAQTIEAEAQRITTSTDSPVTRCTRGRACPVEAASGGGANCGPSRAADAVNERLFLAERGFLDGHGIGPHYTWFKHLVYGPEKDNDYATSPFPGIRDAVADVISSNPGRSNLPSRRAALASEEVQQHTEGEVQMRGASKESGNNEDDGWKALQHEIFRAARGIERASKILEGQLL